ncbi:MAG: phosphoenolpyruvate--protein phosphotransferase [Desulfuromonadaceae bacterium]|nr:phosphoenolpyruvate--protein phosphotransferase [Desulfuromonadaceae bacterium]
MANSAKIDQQELVLHGVAASPGIAIGEAYFLDRQRLSVVEHPIDDELVESELAAFADAVELARQQLRAVQAELEQQSRTEHFYIIDTQLLILQDDMLIGGTTALIRDLRINAAGALKRVLKNFRQTFDRIEDEYLRERGSDIELVGERILRNLAGHEPQALMDLDRRSVIIAHDLSPADTCQLDKRQVVAFVTDLGGRTSHTAILARSLDIPAVVGLENVTRRISAGAPVIVDGCSGEIVCWPSSKTLQAYLEKKRHYEFYQDELRNYCELPARTLDGQQVSVQANLEFPQEAEIARRNGALGVGLLRTEFMYMARSLPPTEEEQLDTYRQIIEEFNPYPVTIRTLDVGGDKFVPDLSLADEANPAMGMRSIRLSLWERKLFRIQLRAILRASAYGRVRLMFPMISGLSEVRACREMLTEVMAELRAQDMAFDENLEMGIMVETPSAVLLADVLAQEVDFFSIGTNDLIQYCLAVDRGNEHVAYLYEPFHPTILRALKTVADAARNAGISLCVCGEMAAEPMYSIVLMSLGYRELSMNSPGISRVKKLIRQWNTGKGEALVQTLLRQKTAADVLLSLHEAFAEFFPEADPGRDF